MLMRDRFLKRLGASYILAGIILTRIFSLFAGYFCIIYVDMSLHLTESVSEKFTTVAFGFTVIAALVTGLAAYYRLKHVINYISIRKQGHATTNRLRKAATREAVEFPRRTAVWETLVDPLITVLPICVSMWIIASAPILLLIQTAVAGFLGISCIIMATFLASEKWLEPVILQLAHDGADTESENYSIVGLKHRLQIGFGVTILVTSVMIAGIAIQRSHSLNDREGVASTASTSIEPFIAQMIAISSFALLVGVSFSHLVAKSITSRTDRLVAAMKLVENDDWTQRVIVTGNDELDILARHFNQMVSELERKNRELTDLTNHLEDRVQKQTAELNASLVQLQELDRMKTDFFSNVSHELRTPLTMILSPLDQLRRIGIETRTSREEDLLKVAELNANRLLKQINHLLEFSRVDAGEMQIKRSPTEIGHLVKRLTLAATTLAEQRGIYLRCSVAAELPVLSLDHDHIETALTNLISNAIKFTPAGGTIEIEASIVETTSVPELHVSVTDTGRGIAPRDLEMLFTRFHQIDGSTSREFSGTGLGLALSFELVRQHNGTIAVESEFGSGSCFCIQIPIDEDCLNLESIPIETKSDLIAPSDFADLESITLGDVDEVIKHTAETPLLLVVDDNDELRSMLIGILKPHYRVESACNGQLGLEAVEEYQPDLILSDVMMPIMDGHEFCRRIKEDEQTFAIPFILLTARSQSEMKIEGLNLGADDYVTKPFHESELLARVKSLLRMRKLHVSLDLQNIELSEALDQVQQMQDQAIQSEKMASLGQLVAGLAHEINNSINVVHNGLPSVSRKLTGIEKTLRLLQPEQESEHDRLFKSLDRLMGVIGDGANRTAALVRDMKAFSHPGVSESVTIDVRESLIRCCNLLSLTRNSPVEIVNRFEEVPDIIGPFNQLDQVFLNLIGNAVDALDGKGRVELATINKEETVEVFVRDNGPGIDPDLQRRIFDPFFTTKPPGKGTGLGLSISYNIIQSAGGTIGVLSTPGEGTEFHITLPKEYKPQNGIDHESNNREQQSASLINENAV